MAGRDECYGAKTFLISRIIQVLTPAEACIRITSHGIWDSSSSGTLEAVRLCRI